MYIITLSLFAIFSAAPRLHDKFNPFIFFGRTWNNLTLQYSWSYTNVLKFQKWHKQRQYIVYKWKKIFIYIKLLHVYFFIELHNYMHTCNTDINIHFEKCYEINFWSWVNCFSSNILKILENWFCMLVVFNEVYIIPQKTNNVVSKVSYHHC